LDTRKEKRRTMREVKRQNGKKRKGRPTVEAMEKREKKRVKKREKTEKRKMKKRRNGRRMGEWSNPATRSDPRERVAQSDDGCGQPSSDTPSGPR
jgi:hypothetical protein